jgi:hypothetical protein
METIVELKQSLFATFDVAESLSSNIIIRTRCLARESVFNPDFFPEPDLPQSWALDEHSSSYIALRNEVSNLSATIQAFRRPGDGEPTAQSTRAYFFDSTTVKRRDLETLRSTMMKIVSELRDCDGRLVTYGVDPCVIENIRRLNGTLITRLRQPG